MKVLKFGGSSVGDAERIEKTLRIILRTKGDTDCLLVIVSACEGITDTLIRAASLAAHGDGGYKEILERIESRHIEIVQKLISAKNQSDTMIKVKLWLNNLADILHGVFLVREFSPRTLDYVMSFGERLSCFIIASALAARNEDAQFHDAREFLVTDQSFGSARVLLEKSRQNIQRRFSSAKGIQVVTGYIGATEAEETTTLGRGGSDYTASIIGAALGAEEIEIWTDVDGMMTADPRKVPKAFSIDCVTYDEAMELCHFGAKVIHPPTMAPAMKAGIPIRIRNTFNPEFPGTVIGNTPSNRVRTVTGVSSISEISLLRVQGSGMFGVVGVASRLFGALANEHINVILITQASSEHTICLAIAPTESRRAARAIDAEFELEINAGMMHPALVEESLTIVSVVGDKMRSSPGVAAKVFQALGKNGINIVAIAQGSSELNISLVISNAHEKKALNALHDELFLSDVRALNLFLVGTGLIGGTLLQQIGEHRQALMEKQSIDLRVIGIANSRRMIFDDKGINLEDLSTLMDASGSAGGIEPFFEIMRSINLPSSIFVDCTASDDVVDMYAKILEANIPVITPNKKANSGPHLLYKELQTTAEKHAVSFHYETSVGAGLPIISTLRDLIRSGDEVSRIDAVLSGTLSYIFNSFKLPLKFSAIVRDARDRGLTEPDPREDLSGRDVARKILILAREAGLALEPEAVEFENLVPVSCLKAATADEFLIQLEKEDHQFEAKLKDAAELGGKLCYVATLENGSAKVRLIKLGKEHPFFSLSGSDNIISFTTTRYNERPLVIKGPGAGAEVTAAGIFADIIRIASRS